MAVAPRKAANWSMATATARPVAWSTALIGSNCTQPKSRATSRRPCGPGAGRGPARHCLVMARRRARWEVRFILFIPKQRALRRLTLLTRRLGVEETHSGIQLRPILAGLDHHRHRHRVPQNQRLLLRVQPRQHLAQLAGAADARENGFDVGLVVEQAGHPCANLA